MKTEDWTL